MVKVERRNSVHKIWREGVYEDSQGDDAQVQEWRELEKQVEEEILRELQRRKRQAPSGSDLHDFDLTDMLCYQVRARWSHTREWAEYRSCSTLFSVKFDAVGDAMDWDSLVQLFFLLALEMPPEMVENR